MERYGARVAPGVVGFAPDDKPDEARSDGQPPLLQTYCSLPERCATLSRETLRFIADHAEPEAQPDAAMRAQRVSM